MPRQRLHLQLDSMSLKIVWSLTNRTWKIRPNTEKERQKALILIDKINNSVDADTRTYLIIERMKKLDKIHEVPLDMYPQADSVQSRILVNSPLV